MSKLTARLLVGIFTLMLFSLSALFLVLPKQTFSELENRHLQIFPKLTLERVLSSSYSEEAERYVIDHFPFRNQWVWLKSFGEGIRLQMENNGVYKGKDHYLLEKFVAPDYQRLNRNIQSLNIFTNKYEDYDFTFLLVPNSVGMYPERLPWLATSYSQKEVNQYVKHELHPRISYLDGFDFLSPHWNDQLYYRTDHHWTTYGAYLSYVAFAELQGWNPLALNDFIVEEVTSEFLGSYHTKSQIYSNHPDTIHLYHPRHYVASQVYIADTNRIVDTLYDESFLSKKDKYSYFLGGVHALMTIDTQLKKDKIMLDNILVIKDSYAHAFVPFLTQHVQHIHIIDTRYYNGSIEDYALTHGIKNVLYLFNTSTLVNEVSFNNLQN